MNRNDSISTNNDDEAKKSVSNVDKYQQFRDTVDVAKWI